MRLALAGAHFIRFREAEPYEFVAAPRPTSGLERLRIRQFAWNIVTRSTLARRDHLQLVRRLLPGIALSWRPLPRYYSRLTLSHPGSWDKARREASG